MAKWSQKERSIGIETTLGEDVLILLGINGEEAISESFEFQLDLVSDNLNITAKEIVANLIDVWIRLNDGSFRYINAYVSRFSSGSMNAEGYRNYTAKVVPWFWFLSRNVNSRIFQGKTVIEVLEAVFKQYSIANFEIDCLNKYQTKDYCVQYQESDFQFVSRLMQENGIFYFFTHEKGKHTLTLIDSSAKYPECMENSVIQSSGGLADDHIASWGHEFEFFTGKWLQKDFNFETPKTDLITSSSTVLDLPGTDKFEKFNYPGNYENRDDGEALTDVRMGQEELGYEKIIANSSYRSFISGAKFNLEQHDFDEEANKSYVITRIRHEARDDTYSTSGSGRTIYQNTFSAIPASIAYQCDNGYRRPKIYGPQTAIVVGPSGDEIYTDKYGRVKVSFHWDRFNAADEKASCWIRVSQPWAGRMWGAISIPRIGQEVIVSFLDGDPDRPIITGRVYNAEQLPPYELPANATMSTFKTNSSKGGDGFNEIRLEDKKDEEQIYIHAQKNLDVRVKSDRFETIGNDRNLVVENDKVEQVKNNRHETVGSNHLEKISGDRNLKVIGQEAKEIGGKLSLKVSGDAAEKIEGSHSEITTGDNYIKSSNLVLEGTDNVTVKVGQSYIAIESSGIKIGTTGTIELEATNSVTVKGTAGVTVESPATAEIKSTNTTVNGDAILTLKGGLVKIN